MTETSLPGAEFERAAGEVAHIMHLLSNERRLLILCKLAYGEKSVTQLTEDLELRQSNVSQQLATLRHDGLVTRRRDAQIVYYSLTDRKVLRIIEVLHELYCREAD